MLHVTNAKVGDTIPIVVDFAYNDTTPSAAEARATTLIAGALRYWNGAAWVAPVTALAGASYSAGRLLAQVVVPAAWDGLLVSIEAVATAPSDVAGQGIAEEYRIATADEDDVLAAVANVDGDLAAHDAAEAARFANAEAARVAMQTVLVAEHDATQASLAAHDAAEAARFAAAEAARAGMQTALVAEHDATQAAVAELDADVGEPADAANDDGTAHAKLRAIANRQKLGEVSFPE